MAFAPWLVSIVHGEYAIVRAYLEATIDPDAECGTTILDSFPFDPAQTDWEEYLLAQFAMSGPPTGAQRGASAVAGLATGLITGDEQDDVILDFGLRPVGDLVPGERLPAGSGGPSFCSQFLAAFGDASGPSLLTTSGGPGVARPTLGLLCEYLDAFLQHAAANRLRLAGSPPLAPQVFPYEDDGDGNRVASTGWPSRGDGPSPRWTPEPLWAGPAPGGPGGRWLHLGTNFFVLEEGQIAERGASPMEADAIGLAYRLIQRSLPDLAAWVSNDFPGKTFGWSVSGADVLVGFERFYGGADSVPMHIIVRPGLTDPAPDAGGRGHPFEMAVSLNSEPGALHSNIPGRTLRLTDTRKLFAAATTLAALRDEARRVLPGPGRVSVADLDDRKVEGAARALTYLAGLLLHESGHPFVWGAFLQDTGVSNDWWNGPVYSGGGNITDYETGASAAALRAQFGIPAGWTPPLPLPPTLPLPAPPIPGNFLPPPPLLPLLILPPPLAVAPHYILQLYGSLFENLLRHESGVLRATTRCRCDTGTATAPTPPEAQVFPRDPGHWGWWYLGMPCRGSGLCSEFPWIPPA